MCSEKTESQTDYKETLNLPKTDFPMRAGLPNREPGWLERWEKIGIYKELRKKVTHLNNILLVMLEKKEYFLV